jgi:hypothetical protein
MARIQTYAVDSKVTANDIWIGSDGDNYNKTKNFSPTKIADYFNSSEKINHPNSITFKYQTIDEGEVREPGTISFKDSNPQTISFSAINNIVVSKRSLGLKYVDGYLSNLTNSIIIIHKGKSINDYGVYKVISVSEDVDEVNFFNLQLSFIQGNNGLIEDKEYILSVVDFYNLEGSDKNFVFTQDVPSDTWNINHGLQKFPSVTVVLSTGQKGYADISYIDENNLTVKFAGDESGKAYIN